MRATIRYFFIGSFVITSESLSLFKALSPSFIFTWTTATNNAFDICKNASYCYARKFETWRQYGTLNNERLTFVNTKFLPKYWRIVALILLPYNISIILKLKGHIKGRLILKILNFKKNLSSGLKTIC